MPVKKGKMYRELLVEQTLRKLRNNMEYTEASRVARHKKKRNPEVILLALELYTVDIDVMQYTSVTCEYRGLQASIPGRTLWQFNQSVREFSSYPTPIPVLKWMQG